LEINISEFIKNFTVKLIEDRILSDKININYNLDDVLITLDQATSFGLIVNESFNYFLSNDPIENLKIEIEFKESKKGYHFLQFDNGKSFDSDIVIGNYKHNLSFVLMDLLSQQLKGDIKFYNNNGSFFDLYFPKI